MQNTIACVLLIVLMVSVCLGENSTQTNVEQYIITDESADTEEVAAYLKQRQQELEAKKALKPVLSLYK